MLWQTSWLLLKLIIIYTTTYLHWRALVDSILLLEDSKNMETGYLILTTYLTAMLLIGVFPSPIYFIDTWAHEFLAYETHIVIKWFFLVAYIIELFVYAQAGLMLLNLPIVQAFTTLKWVYRFTYLMYYYTFVTVYSQEIFKYLYL